MCKTLCGQHALACEPLQRWKKLTQNPVHLDMLLPVQDNDITDLALAIIGEHLRLWRRTKEPLLSERAQDSVL